MAKPQPKPTLAEGEIAVGHETNGTDALVKFLSRHANTLTWLLVAVVAAVAAVRWTAEWREAKTASALAAVAAAQTPEALAKVVVEHAGTRAEEIARFRQAQAELEAGQYAKAAELFNVFRNMHPESVLRAKAFYGQAVAAEAQNRPAEALPLFVSAAEASQGSDDYLAALARLGAGRCAEAAGKRAEAESHYRLAVAGAKGNVADQALEALKRLAP
ncbi:MAG: tetratricopeptide repeat protein [Lentisphaeria bacterium]|jgi:tetratricopeptide (TPR) repeat protein